MAAWDQGDLKEYILSIVDAHDRRYEQRFADQEKSVNAALESSQRAVEKAELASTKRFESVNEFRNTLADQQRTLMPRSETEIRLTSLSDRIFVIEKRAGELVSRGGGMREGWSMLAALIAVIISVVAFLKG